MECIAKDAVTRIFGAIKIREYVEKVKPIRFKESGPILVVCKDIKTKMNILKVAKHLGDGYGRV